MIDITTAVTGSVIGGLTTPGYTLAADTAPSINARRSFVSALTGTQTGVRIHAPTDPFDLTVTKPLRSLPIPRANPITGTVGQAGRNRYETVFRKGTLPLAGQAPQISEIRVTELIVSGSEVNDAANLAALYSLASAHFAREAANNLAKVKTGGI